MWLSQKIKSDPEAKETLQEIAELIDDYSDATNIYKDKSFFAIDIGRLFKPKFGVYATVVLGVLSVESLLFLLAILEVSALDTWVRLSLTVSLPILVLGISLSTVAKSLSESSRFASEYLKDSCQITVFACITFLTVFCGYLSCIFFPAIQNSTISKVIYFLMSSLSVGGALWCLTSLSYIILETTRCMYPEISIEAASNYASRKLSYATLKKVYLSVWMGKYSDILAEHLKLLKNIHNPSNYFSRELLQKTDGENIKPRELIINLPKEINFHLGYRDYELSKLEKINSLLEGKKAELYLAPQSFCSKEFGTLYSKETCDDVYNNISNNLSSIYRFRRDNYIEEEKSFWNEHYLKLHSALSKAIEHYDMAQFRKYLKSIEGIHVFFRRERKNRIIRKYLKPDYEKYRYLLLYSKSVKWLLENTGTIEEDVIELFLYTLIESVEGQVEEDIKGGDWCTLDELKWIVPDTYQLFRNLVKDKKSRLWELRARIGGFYDFAGDLLSQHECDIDKEDKIQIQLILHKGIIKWLLIAIENEDNELVDSLCEAARKMVFPDGVVFTPNQLVTQHFILCGKMLEYLMSKTKSIVTSVFSLLCFDKYDHTAHSNVDFDELVKFFIESRKNDLRSFLHEFSSTNWNRNPLSGGGHGTPIFTFEENMELDYMFIYLSLLCMSFLSEVKPIPIEFWFSDLKGKIGNFKNIAREIKIYDFKNSKEKFEAWLDACDTLYKQKEAQRIAESIIEKEVWQNYNEGFQEGLKGCVPFISYCVKKGYVEESGTASMKKICHMPKELFLNRSSEYIIREGRSHGEEIGSTENTRIIRSIIDFKDEEAEVGKDVGMILIQNDEVRVEAAKEVQKAVDWLKGTGCGTDQGVVILRGVGPDVLHLFEESEYKPAWREKGMERGFEGYHHGYPVLYLQGVMGHPLCAAMDLRDWHGLEVCPKLLNESQVGRVLAIRERKKEEIDKAIEKGTDEIQAKGYCVVELELLWKMPEEKPKQKVFPYPLSPPESKI